MLRLTTFRRALSLLGFLLVLLAAGATAPALASGGGTGGSHGGEHGEGEHHVLYTGDDDRDGIANWLDPKNGTTPNEAYVCGEIGYHAFNLLLFMGLVAYLARRPMLDTFRQRALGIRKGLTDSARDRDEAHQQHQELVARLNTIEQEVETMQVKAQADAKAEEQSLVRRAEEAAVRIGEQAERTIQDEARRARQALREEAVELAVKLAESTLTSQVATDDQQKLAEDFLASLKGADHGQ
ncbi:MAG: hypothetical protein AAF602_14715 [Myxococcota bacterium]